MTALTTAKPPIWNRAEPIFGVCEALGDDFGINPHWIRAALIPLLVWQPLWTIGGYALLGLIVLATRLLFPDVRETHAAEASPALAQVTEPNDAPTQQEQHKLAA